MPPTLLVLAAGMGSRYGGLKQLDPVGPSGETLLDYSVYDAQRAGFGRLVFVIRQEMEATFREKIVSRYEDKIPTALAFQEIGDLPGEFEPPEGRSKPWGTGHAIYAARESINEPFAVINADDFYGRDAFAQAAGELTREGAAASDYALVAYRMANTLSDHGAVSRAVCQMNDAGELTTITEIESLQRTGESVVGQQKDTETPQSFSGDELVSLNLWCLRPGVFAELERLFTTFLQQHGAEEKSEFYIPFAIDALIKEGTARAKVLPTTSHWTGITYREDKPRVEDFIKGLVTAGEYPASLS
ncbi:MAG: NTP transferase domain-containing protein [Verrucomicrobiota bacterium]